VDDLNDWIGCLDAHPNAKSPNIDRLAKRGTLFTNAHCQAPICGPSRTSLFSGLYPNTTGMYQQPISGQLQEDRRYFRGKLMPDYFGAHGYKTMGCGKTLHGYQETLAFQEYGPRGSSGPKVPNKGRLNYHLPDTGYTGTQTDWGAFPESDDLMPDYKTASWAVEQLGQSHEKPFFLAVGFNRPHVPFYVPQKWFDMHPLDQIQTTPIRMDDFADVPEVGVLMHEMPQYPGLAWLRQNNDEQLRLCTQAYLACITFMDAQVGRVLDALDASPYADNTVIVLFSDHGYHIGEKDRVSKHGLWEEATRVPMIVTRPGGVGGLRSAKPVGLIDLYPTLVELCGLPKNETNEGHSLVPLLDDPNAKWRDTVSTTYARGNHALRSERYRYIRYDDGTEELYDHLNDPNEWTNLAGHPGQEATLERFRAQVPGSGAPYHKATGMGVVNRWFSEHYKKNGLRPDQ
jgi:arylsulfatase A-like enzyme